MFQWPVFQRLFFPCLDVMCVAIDTNGNVVLGGNRLTEQEPAQNVTDSFILIIVTFAQL